MSLLVEANLARVPARLVGAWKAIVGNDSRRVSVAPGSHLKFYEENRKAEVTYER